MSSNWERIIESHAEAPKGKVSLDCMWLKKSRELLLLAICIEIF